MTNDRTAQLDSANRLEELGVALGEMVRDLRIGKPHAYARVYWLRRELGRVVTTLGTDAPSSHVLRDVAREYEELISND